MAHVGPPFTIAKLVIERTTHVPKELEIQTWVTVKMDDLTVVLALVFTHFPQSGASKISKLVYNSNNYGLWYL